MGLLSLAAVISALVPAVFAEGGAASSPSPALKAAVKPLVGFNYALSGLDWNGTCSTGKRQSPINLDPSSQTVLTLDSSKSPRLAFGTGTNVSVYNTGHTIQVQWATGIPSNATVRLGAFLGQPNVTGPVGHMDNPSKILGDADDRLKLKPVQWHVHTPSEHTVNGKLSALEAHLVTAIPQTKNFSFCPPTTGCLAVFGVLYDITKDLNDKDPFLTQFLSNMPTKVGTQYATNLTTPLNFRDFFPQDSQYNSYAGSLTTPPCSENVLWTVMTTPRYLSIGQLAKLQLALGETENEEECYPVNEGTKIGQDVPEFTQTKAANGSGSFTLCAEQGGRTNDRFPQPLNGRTVWDFKDLTFSA